MQNRNRVKELYLKMNKNFVTPNVVTWDITKDYRVIEYAYGLNMLGEYMYGVSEFIFKGESLESTNRGELFRDAKEARKHYKFLLTNK